MHIAIVYRSGGDFDIQYVKAITHALRRFGKYKGEIFCLTDRVSEVKELNDPIPLELSYQWPGWWSKIELFQPGLFNGPILYFDLDTFIIDEINLLLQICKKSDTPLFLRGNHPTSKINDWLASGMMFWRGDDLRVIYDTFMEQGSKKCIYEQIQNSTGSGQKGDQGFIRKVLNHHNVKYGFFQDKISNKQYILFKRNIVADKKDTAECHIINWSGKKRPHREDNLYHEFWLACLVD